MGNDNGNGNNSFHIRDCALVRLSTGYRAQNLRELREALAKVEADSIYYHFWARQLQPLFGEPEYINDFASWVRHGLHEKALAERLAMIAPTDFVTVEELRAELLECVEEALDSSDLVPWAKADQQFYFVRSQLIVMDTRKTVHTPRELGKIMNRLPYGSIFYHFIDARRRRESNCDDICHWLGQFGDKYEKLRKQISVIDPYFSALKSLRFELSEIFENYDWGKDDE